MLSMLVQVTLFACLICAGLGAYLPLTKCPESCHCTQDDLNGSVRLKCTSLVFLAKLQPKQILAIEALDLSGQDLRHIDAKLNRLRNLKELNLANNSLTHHVTTTAGSFPKLPKLFSLDLSGNRLKRINASSLPGTLEILNLSHTDLTKIPEDILELSDLRQLNIQGNPLRCDCSTTSVRDKLLKASVLLTKPVMCRDVAGNKAPQSLFTVSCAEEQDWDQMAGDDPFAYEGSGKDQAQDLHAIDNDGIADSKLSIDEEEFLPPSLPDKHENDNGEQVEGDEGSGDEEYATTTETPSDDYDYDGSGLGFGETNTETEAPYIPPPEHDNACIFDCSTETPPTTTVDPFDEPAPGIIDGFRILLTDITGQKEKEPEPEPVSEPTIVRTIHKELAELPEPTDTDNSDKDDKDDNDSLVEVFDRESTKESDELMRQQTETQEGSMKTYFIIGALLVIMICLVIYSVIKKKRSRYPHQPNDDESTYKIPPSELQDMSHKKQAIDLPEKVPLMNGQNGTSAPKENGNGVEDKSTAPYPSTDKSMDKLHPTPTSHPHSEDVQLRDKDDGSRLIPETHRVTVQAKELNTPKTPLLVNRHRSDDGTIVTTPTTEQNS